MFGSIKKYTSSILVKILVGIIILPFVFWGMGDVFSGGNKNIVATIGSEKISTKEFADYLNRLNLTEEQRKNLKKSNLLNEILSNYIGKKIIDLEINEFDIKLSDKSLKDIIVTDKTFFKNDKFSRTEYEKFLLQSGVTAPYFEKNLSEQEKKMQLLSFLSLGAIAPEFLVQKFYNEENQVKNIKYISLDKYYNSINIKENEMLEVYEKNKDAFNEKLKLISYAELTPQKLTGEKEYNDDFFKKIDSIDNLILDGKEIEEISKFFNFKLLTTNFINSSKKNSSGVVDKIIDDELFKKIFQNKKGYLELINLKNKYFIASIKDIKETNKGFSNKDVKDAIKMQITIKNKIELNTEIAKKISSGSFKKSQMEKFAKEKSLDIRNTQINGLKKTDTFSIGLIKQIFKIKDNQIELVTDNLLTKNFIVYSEKTNLKKIEKGSEDFKKYESKVKADLTNKIYIAYDKSVNAKYKINVNQKVFNRLKNSLQ